MPACGGAQGTCLAHPPPSTGRGAPEFDPAWARGRAAAARRIAGVTHPAILHADDDLLAVLKPAGVNTHRPAPEAPEGVYEWARRVLAPGEDLSLLHRLDKETSGVLVLGRSTRANQSLAAQLEQRRCAKAYLLLTPHDPRRPGRQRCDERLPTKRRRPRPGDDQEAVTEFEVLERGTPGGLDLVEARPHTGRTHQVRLHATRLGMPILGDAEYGGAPAVRLFLHAARFEADHPAGGRFRAAAPRPASFDLVLAGRRPGGARVAAQAALEARAALFDPADTEAYLWIDRHPDGFPDLRVERLGAVAVAIRYDDGAGPLKPAWVQALMAVGGLTALVEQRRPKRGLGGPPQVLSGSLPSLRFEVQELGLRYLVDLEASPTSTGLFLDQRETRRRLLSLDLSGKSVLNAFAHTGALSVAAARAGATTLTLDLSRRYLAWAQENLRLNGLDPAAHDFIYGDALDWMRRLGKKGRAFDLVLVDPPSASTSRAKGKKGRTKRWSVERDLGDLVEQAARLVAPGGTLYVSTNLHRMTWDRFRAQVEEGLQAAERQGVLEPWTLPLDHRTGPGDPPYLKAAWLALDGA